MFIKSDIPGAGGHDPRFHEITHSFNFAFLSFSEVHMLYQKRLCSGTCLSKSVGLWTRILFTSILVQDLQLIWAIYALFKCKKQEIKPRVQSISRSLCPITRTVKLRVTKKECQSKCYSVYLAHDYITSTNIQHTVGSLQVMLSTYFIWRIMLQLLEWHKNKILEDVFYSPDFWGKWYIKTK